VFRLNGDEDSESLSNPRNESCLSSRSIGACGRWTANVLSDFFAGTGSIQEKNKLKKYIYIASPADRNYVTILYLYFVLIHCVGMLIQQTD